MTKYRLIFFAIAQVLFCSIAFSGETLGSQAAMNSHDECFTKAAEKFSLNKRLLKAIAHTESRFRAEAIGPDNNNGSYDIGIMQINSSWLPTLKKYGIDKSELMNACTNIHVGAWILANNIATYGETWRSVGAYNARSEQKRQIYVSRVQKSYALLSAMGV